MAGPRRKAVLRQAPPTPFRRDAVRIPPEIAARVRAGHPWIFRDALGSRTLSQPSGAVIEILDRAGEFVARALYDAEGAIALRVASRRPTDRIDPAYLEARLQTAKELRERWLDCARIT